MQIFSPYPSFESIAKCLDRRRLNKQKIELYQIINCIKKGEAAKGWKNHPAVKMTRGYELFFIDYGLTIARECLKRGFKDTMIPKIEELKGYFNNPEPPPYWGREDFHVSHMSNLIRKLPEHYRKFWPDVPSDLPYVWPV